MLPDFRFVLGAILAIALLAVAGLGLVTSVQLAREARMVPLADARSLAFAGHAEWNQFYDPDGARRFEGLAGKTESPVVEARLETAAETSPAIAPPVIAPVSPEERTADIPTSLLEPIIAPDVANDKTPDKTPQTDRPHTAPPQSAEARAAVTVAAPPAGAMGPPEPDGATVSGAPAAERVASAPATLPGPDQETQAPTSAQPQATGDPLQDPAPPTPRARPKAQFRKRIARAHIRSVASPSQQTLPNSGFPPLWPGYDNQFTGATTTKNTGKLTGTLSNRPQ
jgi:hypothetical protein